METDLVNNKFFFNFLFFLDFNSFIFQVATTGSQKYVTIMEEEIQKSLHIAEEAKLTNQGQQKNMEGNMEGNIAMKQVSVCDHLFIIYNYQLSYIYI